MTTVDPHISSRKDDHVRLANQFYGSAPADAHAEIDGIQFVHNALPETSVADVDLSSSFAGLHLKRPYFINAMTGGTECANDINRRLARVAQATGSPLALGSMSIAVKNPSTRQAYAQLREDFPDVQFIANLGAEHTRESAQMVVDLIGASALQIHLNAAQEIVMPEGEKDFRGWQHTIETCVHELKVPVIVKEVGFGISHETAQNLIKMGVSTIDVAGSGGTNFIQIENARNSEHHYDYLESWGMSTIRSLMETVYARTNAHMSSDALRIIASGGVRHPFDIMKYVALGADAVGLSAAFLHSITSSEDADEAVESTIALMHQWDEQCAQIMAMLAVTRVEQLQTTALYTLPLSLRDYLSQRFSM